MLLLGKSKVLLNKSMVLLSKSIVLLNKSMVLLYLSMVLLWLTSYTNLLLTVDRILDMLEHSQGCPASQALSLPSAT